MFIALFLILYVGSLLTLRLAPMSNAVVVQAKTCIVLSGVGLALALFSR